MIADRITGRYVVTATLHTTAPLRIAKGNASEFSNELALLLREGQPYLPGSSLAGALHARWQADKPHGVQPATLEAFWGTTGPQQGQKKTSTQSHLLVRDAMCITIPGQQPWIVLRDGVRINSQTGTVDQGKYYQYEVLEPGAVFQLQMEVVERQGMDMQALHGILHWLRQTLATDFQVGGNTSKGFGLVKVEDFRCWHLPFPAAASAWLAYCRGVALPKDLLLDLDRVQPLATTARRDFALRASFSLRGSFLAGGGKALAEATEGDQQGSQWRKVHLQSHGQPVLSGKSLTGALRHRASRILDEAGVKEPEKCIGKLFGPLLDGQDKADKKARRARLHTREAALAHAGEAHTQQRIRVDRFTAAPVDTGLFSSEPIWRKAGGTFTLEWRIPDYHDWEVCLLLHLLKDLWTGDLALGGEKSIGRGRLQGVSATCTAPGIDAAFRATSEGDGITWERGRGQLAPFNQSLQVLNPHTPQP